MDVIRKYITIDSDTIHVPELKEWMNRKVELIVMPAEEPAAVQRPYGLARGEFKVEKMFFDALPKEIEEHFR